MPAVPPLARVLLVDDHRDTLEMYVIGLQASAFEVVPVDGAAAARSVASTMSPDVIVPDVRLAGECGMTMGQDAPHPAPSAPHADRAAHRRRATY